MTTLAAFMSATDSGVLAKPYRKSVARMIRMALDS
jgi:hypothetical protein